MIGMVAVDDPLFDPESTALPKGDLSETLKEWVDLGKPKLNIRVVTEPPLSVKGRPVVVERVEVRAFCNGRFRPVGAEDVVLDDRTGVEKAMIALRWRRDDLAKASGKGRRAIENYLGHQPRRRVPTEVLLVLKTALEARK